MFHNPGSFFNNTLPLTNIYSGMKNKLSLGFSVKSTLRGVMPFFVFLGKGQNVLLCFLMDLTSPPHGIIVVQDNGKEIYKKVCRKCKVAFFANHTYCCVFTVLVAFAA